MEALSDSYSLTESAQLQAHWNHRLRLHTSEYMGECFACQLLRAAQWRHGGLHLDDGGSLAVYDVHDSINVSEAQIAWRVASLTPTGESWLP